mmetsp:Transcript_44159/g.127496  ORF Transcript_44159/g.127496 Transcript_44159/m.127496 type:complete len:276 (-) Transcript_44159:519-1346(-)
MDKLPYPLKYAAMGRTIAPNASGHAATARASASSARPPRPSRAWRRNGGAKCAEGHGVASGVAFGGREGSRDGDGGRRRPGSAGMSGSAGGSAPALLHFCGKEQPLGLGVVLLQPTEPGCRTSHALELRPVLLPRGALSTDSEIFTHRPPKGLRRRRVFACAKRCHRGRLRRDRGVAPCREVARAEAGSARLRGGRQQRQALLHRREQLGLEVEDALGIGTRVPPRGRALDAVHEILPTLRVGEGPAPGAQLLRMLVPQGAALLVEVALPRRLQV